MSVSVGFSHRCWSSPTSRGVESGDVTIGLTGPKMLRITVRRTEEGEQEGYAIRERFSGEMARIVNLLAEVTGEGAAATLRKGVLVVRLRKVTGGQGLEIPIREELGGELRGRKDSGVTAVACRSGRTLLIYLPVPFLWFLPFQHLFPVGFIPVGDNLLCRIVPAVQVHRPDDRFERLGNDVGLFVMLLHPCPCSDKDFVL